VAYQLKGIIENGGEEKLSPSIEKSRRLLWLSRKRRPESNGSGEKPAWRMAKILWRPAVNIRSSWQKMKAEIGNVAAKAKVFS
jgi:hypothetical protein